MRKVFVTLLMLALIQDPVTHGAQIVVDVTERHVALTVSDSSGRYVRNMKADDFVIEENGIIQEILHIATDRDTPINLALLLDVSGSMWAPVVGYRRIDAAIACIGDLLDRLQSKDRVSLMTFEDAVKVKADFTEDRARIRKLAFETRPGRVRFSNITSPSIDALKRLSKSALQNKALIVVTDGEHQVGTSTKELEQAIRASDNPLLFIGIPSSRPPKALYPPTIDTGELIAAVSRAGGRTVALRLESFGSQAAVLQFNQALEDLETELRGQYVLSFRSQIDERKSIVRVRTTNPSYRVQIRRDVRTTLSKAPARH